MINEIADGDAAREFGHAAEMVAVPVRGDEVVDLREAGVFNSGHNPAGVPGRRRSAIPGIYEHGFARWRDEKSGVATLHVHDINVECLARLRATSRNRSEKTKNQ